MTSRSGGKRVACPPSSSSLVKFTNAGLPPVTTDSGSAVVLVAMTRAVATGGSIAEGKAFSGPDRYRSS